MIDETNVSMMWDTEYGDAGPLYILFIYRVTIYIYIYIYNMMECMFLMWNAQSMAEQAYRFLDSDVEFNERQVLQHDKYRYMKQYKESMKFQKLSESMMHGHERDM
jgi:hypothetical protein